MKLIRHNIAKRFLASMAAFFMAAFFCLSPNMVLPAYANSNDISSSAILSKGSFGILKRINDTYYLVDEFGNIIDVVAAGSGVDLQKYIGRYILVKDNIFAGFAEYQRKNDSNNFLNGLKGYLLGFGNKYKAKFNSEPIPQPMYGVVPPEDDPEDEIKFIEPPSDEEPPPPQCLYGIIPPEDDPEDEIKFIEPPSDEEPPPPQCLYGIIPPEDEIKPPDQEPPPSRVMYGVEPPIPIDEEGPLLDKIAIIEEQRNNYSELSEKGIKIVPQMNNGESLLKINPEK